MEKLIDLLVYEGKSAEGGPERERGKSLVPATVGDELWGCTKAQSRF